MPAQNEARISNDILSKSHEIDCRSGGPTNGVDDLLHALRRFHSLNDNSAVDRIIFEQLNPLPKESIKKRMSREKMAAAIAQAHILLETVFYFYTRNAAGHLVKSKKTEFLIPRRVFCYLARDLLKLNFSALGRVLGGYDRGTAKEHAASIARELRQNKTLAIEIEKIKTQFAKDSEAKKLEAA